MQYPSLHYLPESDDPSLTLETANLIAKIIDNTGLLPPPVPPADTAFLNSTGRFTRFTHHLGYHGIRTLYDKTERRNIVAAFYSWLNLQQATITGLQNDPRDERSVHGVGRGWPMRLEKKGRGALLTIDPMPLTQFSYTLELQPAEPDAIDFSFRFTFHKKVDTGPVKFEATWPCYVNGYDDVRLHYPQGDAANWQWASLGEKPDLIIGEPVNYKHTQQAATAVNQAFPLAYGRIGEHAVILMHSDPRVTFFCVNTGGHSFLSPVQNPAWDWHWQTENYPLNTPVGFNGRLIYTRFQSQENVVARYEEWKRSSSDAV